MLFNKLDDWLNWLESLHPNTIDMGLERVQAVAEHLQLDFSSISVFTVAGTNGKGSCVATLEALLQASGEQVGVYTSPHFIRYNERVRINGREATDQELCAAFDTVESVRGDTQLTYFEYGTLAALVLFVEARVSAVALEVGLGGRLDAVNIIDPDVAIITSIDIDHQDWLGDNREDIGFEKAGIYRANTPAICADLNPPESVIRQAITTNAPLLRAGQNFSWQQQEENIGEELNWGWSGSAKNGEQRSIVLPFTPLPMQSIAAAIQGFLIWGGELDDKAIQRVVAETRLMGRCQRVDFDGRKIVMDVAHNPAAATFLSEQLKRLFPAERSTAGESGAKVVAVFAAMEDKEFKVMLEILSPSVDRWVFCGLPDIPRAASAEGLQEIGESLGLTCSAWDTVNDGFEHVLESTQKDDQILVLGSFFTIAEVVSAMQPK